MIGAPPSKKVLGFTRPPTDPSTLAPHGSYPACLPTSSLRKTKR